MRLGLSFGRLLRVYWCLLFQDDEIGSEDSVTMEVMEASKVLEARKP